MTGQMVYEFLDPWLIWAFRSSENPYVGFAVGIFFVCIAATVIGELCMAGIYLSNKKHFAAINRDMVDHHNLSVRALGVKDKTAWKACNSIANDAFGKNFFSRIALFASSLWLVPFALGWLSYRFGEVDFVVPFLGAVGPAFIFIPAYIVTRILFSKAKPWIPFFKTLKKKIDDNERGDDMMTFQDLVDESDQPSKNDPLPEGS